MKQFLLAIILIEFFIQQSHAQTASWHRSQAPFASERYDDLFFSNEQTGWSVDFAGILLKTTDGGQHWQSLNGPGAFGQYRSLMFLDSSVGFLGNLAPIPSDSAFLYKSTDGGISWQPINNLPGPYPAGICGMCRFNDSIGFAVGDFYGPSSFYKTTNKGTSWSYVDLSPYMSGAVDVYFWSPDSGIVSGLYGSSNYQEDSGGIVISTFDGGNTWSVRHKTAGYSAICWKIIFPSSNTGYVSVEQFNDDSTYYFLKTTDHGITWQDKIYHTGSYYNAEGIGFVNDSVGWIGGYFNVFKTVDGGETWNIDFSFADSSLNRFRKVSDSIAFFSGTYVNRYSVEGYYTSSNQHWLSPSDVIIQPNPSRKEIKVLLRLLTTSTFSIDVVNTSGARVFHQSPQEYHAGDNYLFLHPEKVEPGVYFVVFSNDKTTITRKVVVQ